MRITLDTEVNAAYVAIADDVRDGDAVEQVVIERPDRGDVVLDFDAAGHLLGIEIIGANELLRESVLAAAEHL